MKARIQHSTPHPLLVKAHFVRLGISTDLHNGTINNCENNSQVDKRPGQPNPSRGAAFSHGPVVAIVTGYELNQGLIDRDFKQSKVDPCVFFKGNLILVIYVDDVIAFCPSEEPINEFIKAMQQNEPTAFILEDQGNRKDNLRIEIVPKGDKIPITQKHLIQKVLQMAQLDTPELKTPPTPASGLLLKHSGSPPLAPEDIPFNYQSIIQSLNYLAGTTHPDITFAVHQCARFCNEPKKEHFMAVKRIVRYLAGTQDKGLILAVQKPFIECFCDADFAGDWDKTDPEDPLNVKSCTGFIIKFANCPIHWASKKQELTALSTVEAECIALSTTTQHVLFILHLLQDLK